MAKSLLIAIVGPTASGKSDLAVNLAKKFDGEVVSADSRQVYKGLDIGSGKITAKEMMGIPHHLLNVASPKRAFTVAQYQLRAMRAITAIKRRKKLPILAGGSPLYVYAITDGWKFPEVKPDPKLRLRLGTLSPAQLFHELQKLDPVRAASIEKGNPRRLIRALEIVLATGKPVPQLRKNLLPYPVLFLGVRRTPAELKQRIAERLAKRLRQGMVEEVKNLHASDVSWRRLEELGLEYRYVAQYIEEKITKQQMVDLLQKAIQDFARRQMVWFKKDQRIHWISSYAEAEKFLSQFLAHVSCTSDRLHKKQRML